ncbi:PREDICTED: zinc finger BED domain-containing protein RICESLEEPER 2-like [Ipomoea nil]|uniref:zinc finger BED domain-containing protein RICESLEEPER 2-like n=1 Tax=Ipomoea nil TaxID=35883 RepID=UPI000900E9B9|nr:PREDICTED: zinc finger BED domain-containing protein RICESLEEPER 2-like [Ipomoea nil]
MDNISIPSSGCEPPNSSAEGATAVEAQTVDTTTQQTVLPTAAVPAKKRKVVESRSRVWDHFQKITDSNNVTIEAKCIYCAKLYQCQSKKHGTTSLRNHMVSCMKNPHSKDTRQSLLTFQAVATSDASEPTVGDLGTWVFNQETIKRALVEMIIIDELPFIFVEGQEFRRFIAVACPRFKIPSRWTISRDINVIYEEEKLNLKCLFKGNTQRMRSGSYIKKLSFVPVTSHKGEYIAKALESCLIEWGLRNVFTVTVDNASSNDVALGFLKRKVLSWGSSSVKSKYLHMRCIAHILNLVVQDGLKQCDIAIKRVREVVRYVRSSPSRLKKFRDLVEYSGIEQKTSLCLDVPTRWNSTYLMLQSALIYQKVFDDYEYSDNSSKSDLCDSIPTSLDWEYVNNLVKLLKCFYEMTIRISGSLYVTANTFFSEISDLYCILNEMVEADGAVKLMGANMKAKFEKYWGDIDKMNYMIFFANILDPRDKLEYMPTQLVHMYGDKKGKDYLEKLLAALNELYDDYAVSYNPSVVPATGSGSVASVNPVVESVSAPVGRPQHLLKAQIKKERMETGGRKKTELEYYLSGAITEDEGSFDILRWWKVNSARFPILSKIARDILAIPISTVASESAFSTSGRVLDPFRSSLTPKIVEALVCTQDWLRLPNTPISIEENLEELERFEKEFSVDGGSASGGRTCGTTLPSIPAMKLGDFKLLPLMIFDIFLQIGNDESFHQRSEIRIKLEEE